jgi:hypothetical protein
MVTARTASRLGRGRSGAYASATRGPLRSPDQQKRPSAREAVHRPGRAPPAGLEPAAKRLEGAFANRLTQGPDLRPSRGVRAGAPRVPAYPPDRSLPHGGTRVMLHGCSAQRSRAIGRLPDAVGHVRWERWEFPPPTGSAPAAASLGTTHGNLPTAASEELWCGSCGRRYRRSSQREVSKSRHC